MASENVSKINQNVCGLCKEKQSKYCCPRCEVFYCSLDCYKSEQHLECAETFYRDCVTEELTGQQSSAESRAKMIDILKRMQEDDDNIDINDLIEYDDSVDSDDGDEIAIEERIKGLNLDNPDELWNALTEDERNEFEALLSQGDVGTIMPQWEPWWMYHKEKKLVEDVEQTVPEELEKCPQLRTVPDFSTLTKVQPSPALKNNITNVLASYAFIMRYFNGEVQPSEAAVYLLNICGNLDSNTNFEDPAIAVESVAQKCLQSQLIQTDEASIMVMKKDTYLILRGPSDDNRKHYCKAALSDLHSILSSAKSSDKSSKSKTNTQNVKEFSRKFPEHKSEHLPNLDVSKLKKCVKKIEFYLSYIDSYDMEFE